jgi:hypothetical protein
MLKTIKRRINMSAKSEARAKFKEMIMKKQEKKEGKGKKGLGLKKCKGCDKNMKDCKCKKS